MVNLQSLIEAIFSNPLLCLEAGLLAGLPMGLIIALIIFNKENDND